MKVLAWIKYYFLLLSTPAQKVMQHVGRAETLMTKAQVDKCLSVIQAGDILLSHENQRLTSLFIKGFYDHAAIVSSKMTVIEAIGSGTQEVDLTEWLFKKDYVCVIRPNLPQIIRMLAAANSLSLVGLPYDYTFSSRNENPYCSEIPYICYKTEDSLFLHEIKDKRDEILPEDYLDLCKTSEFILLLNTKEN